MNVIRVAILPNAANVLVVLIVIDKSRLPPRSTVHIFDAPPAGELPVKNNPNCISTLFGNKNIPRKYADYGEKIFKINGQIY